MEKLITLANLFFLTAYLVRDILWLRVFVVLGGFTMLPYLLFLDEPVAIFWRVVFILLNLTWITLLLRERRPAHLTAEERKLHGLALRTLKPREVRRLFDAGEWCTFDESDLIQRQGESYGPLQLIASGRARIVKDGRRIAEIGVGNFVGAIPFFTHETALVDVIATEGTRLVSWKGAVLQPMIDRNPDLKVALQAVVVGELARYLKDVTDPDRGL